MADQIPFDSWRLEPRFAPLTTPWTQLLVDYAADDVTWQPAVFTLSLDEPDDIGEPGRVSFSVPSQGAGLYRVRLVDAEGNTHTYEPPRRYPDPRLPVIPTLEEIGTINRARTMDDETGDTTGTFSAGTRPTADEAADLAVTAADKVANRLGVTIPAQFYDRARAAAALYGAALVEGGAHEPREGLMKFWTDMADEAVDALATAIADVGAGGEEGPGDDQPAGPLFSFPAADPLPSGA